MVAARGLASFYRIAMPSFVGVFTAYKRVVAGAERILGLGQRIEWQGVQDQAVGEISMLCHEDALPMPSVKRARTAIAELWR